MNNITSRKYSSKEQKMRRMRKLIKESNSQMLDIYTGLKNIKQNKVATFNNLMSTIPQSNNSDFKTLKMGRSLRNIDKLAKIGEASINTKIPVFIEKVIDGKINKDSKYDFFHEHNNEILYNRSIFLSMNHMKIIMKGIMTLNTEDN